jgi:hypothetical protein
MGWGCEFRNGEIWWERCEVVARDAGGKERNSSVEKKPVAESMLDG